MPDLLQKRKIVYPVLLDPTEHYKDAWDVAVWPVATLLDEKGRVVWQGVTGLKGFDTACEKQLEALLASR